MPTPHIFTPFIISSYKFSLLQFYNKSSRSFVEGSVEACRSEGRQGTVNTRHGSPFKVMNSNESSAGRLLGDKKSIWPPGRTSFSYAVSQARLSGDVPLPTSHVANSTRAPESHTAPFYPLGTAWLTLLCSVVREISPWALRCDLGALWHFCSALLGHHRPQLHFHRPGSPLPAEELIERGWENCNRAAQLLGNGTRSPLPLWNSFKYRICFTYILSCFLLYKKQTLNYPWSMKLPFCQQLNHLNIVARDPPSYSL